MSFDPSVRPSVHNEVEAGDLVISDPDRGRWDVHDGMTFKVTEGQGQGHEAFEVAKMTIFKFYLLRHFSSDLEFDCSIWIYGTISKFGRAGFSIFAFVLVSRDFKVGKKMRKWRFSKSISSYISQAILNLIVAYESMGQYLNLVGTDFRISLSFSRHVTSKFAKTALPSEGYIFSTGHGKS